MKRECRMGQAKPQELLNESDGVNKCRPVQMLPSKCWLSVERLGVACQNVQAEE